MPRKSPVLGHVFVGEIGALHAERIEDSGLHKLGIWHAGILFDQIGGDVKALTSIQCVRSGFPHQRVLCARKSTCLDGFCRFRRPSHRERVRMIEKVSNRQWMLSRWQSVR